MYTATALVRNIILVVCACVALGASAVIVLPHISRAEHVQACAMEYAPVCGERDVVCVRAPCPSIQETFGNRCALDAAHVRFLHNGECRGEEVDIPPPYEPPKNCTAWFDGCNTCTRGENGAVGCTKKFCAEPEIGYCTEYDEEDTLPIEENTGTIPAVFKETGKSFVEFFHTLLTRLFGWAIL